MQLNSCSIFLGSWVRNRQHHRALNETIIGEKYATKEALRTSPEESVLAAISNLALARSRSYSCALRYQSQDQITLWVHYSQTSFPQTMREQKKWNAHFAARMTAHLGLSVHARSISARRRRQYLKAQTASSSSFFGIQESQKSWLQLK